MKFITRNALFLLILLFVHKASAEYFAPLTPSTIFIAGDSTAASYTNSAQQGWGPMFQHYFNSDNISIENHASGGKSSRTFITEGLWQKLIANVAAGDVVIIQFGHNDASPINDIRRARGTLTGIGDNNIDIQNLITNQQERVYSFGHYIRKMVEDVKAKKALPILVSLTVRNIWKNHRIERGSGQYGLWMYQLANELDTPYIDLSNAAADELESLGKINTNALYPKDHTHFNSEGADLHARLIVAQLKGLRPSLAQSLYSEKGKAVKGYDWTFVKLPVVANKEHRSVFFVGDSTVRNGRGDGANQQWGWGDFVYERLDNPGINIVNRAVGGLSSRTYISQGHWQRALAMMKPGDIVLVQFGHNDSSQINDAIRARGTLQGIGHERKTIDNMLTGQKEVVRSYGAYLRQIIGDAKANGILPIICSPVPRKIWHENTPFIVRDDESYPLWASQVARQSNTPFIDLHNLVAQRYEALGREEVSALFGDARTHTNKEGARLTADIVTKQLAPIVGISAIPEG